MNSPERLTPGGRLTMAALSAIGSTGYGMLSPAIPELADVYAVSEPAVGVLQGAVAAPGIVLAVLLGGLSDRFGRGRTAVFCLLLFAGAGTACVWVDSYPVALTLRVLQGVGFAGLLTIPPTVLGEQLAGEERRKALAVNTLVLTSASMLGPVAGALLASTGDPRNAYAIYAIGLLLVPITVRTLGLRTGSGRNVRFDPRAVVGSLRGRRSLRSTGTALGLVTIVLVLITGTTAGILPLALDRVFDVPLALRGFWVSLSNIGSVVASALLAAVAVRARDRWYALGGLSLIGSMLLAVSAGPEPWVVAACLVLVGVGVSSAYNASLHHVSKQEIPERGLLVGTWAAAGRLGQATGPTVGALLVSTFGPLAAFGAMGFAGLGVALLALIGLWLARPRQSPSP